MLGAIIGDIVGSRFEFNNIKTIYLTKVSIPTSEIILLAKMIKLIKYAALTKK